MSKVIAFIPYIQIILAVAVVLLVLLQQSDADLGGAFGGSDLAGAPTHTRRGMERALFYLTIVVGILFALSVLGGLVLH